MKYNLILLFVIFVLDMRIYGQTDSTANSVQFESVIHFGKVIKNAPEAPNSKMAFVSELTLSIQTKGKKEWHILYNYPSVGFSVLYGNMGNKQEIGNMLGFLPSLTFNSANKNWFVPRIKLGLGMAYFNNPYNAVKNPTNFYIGSALTAMGYASVYVQPRLNKYFSIKAGLSVIHCSNGHVQIPNLGINLPGVFAGIIYTPNETYNGFVKNDIITPKNKVHFNLSTGIGVHELAKTTEPIGTSKYAIYIVDLYLSKLYGKINNLQTGISFKNYNSYLTYIEKTGLFPYSERYVKSTVVTIYIGDELMMGKFSLLTQGGFNVYNQFYKEYIKQYKSMTGFKTELKKYISTKMGLQYYLRNPRYCSVSNIYAGVYIKANFGQADFLCTQIGFVF